MDQTTKVNGANSSDAHGVAIRPPVRRRPALATVDGVRREMCRVYRQVRSKQLGTQDGIRMTNMLTAIAKTIEASELQTRLEALEAAIAVRKQ